MCPEYFRSQAEVSGPGRVSDRKRQRLFVTGSNAEAGTNVGAKNWREKQCCKLLPTRRISSVIVLLFNVQAPLEIKYSRKRGRLALI